MRHYLLISLLIIICFTSPSCKLKRDAKVFYALYAEIDLLHQRSNKNCKSHFYLLKRVLENSGSKFKHIEQFKQVEKFNDSLISLQNRIQLFQDSIFKSLGADLHHSSFDTVGLLKTINLNRPFLKLLDFTFKNSLSYHDYKELHKLLIKEKRDFQFIKIEENSASLKLPSEYLKTGAVLLALSALQLEIDYIRLKVLEKSVKKINTGIDFGSAPNPVLTVTSNIIEEGEQYQAELFFVSKAEIDNDVSMKVNGQSIPVNNNIGEVILEAKADHFDTKGLCKKTWQGEITFPTWGRDTTFIINKEYYVKKKCYAK